VKAFQFPLERVLSWRQTEQTMAEAALARLLGEQRSTQQARADLQTGRVTAQVTVARAPSSQGTELDKLDRLRMWTVREDGRLSTRLQELQKAVEDQKRVVANAARNVRMLERLRTRRHSEWKAEMDHEMETLTGEWAVTQWRRNQKAAEER
jgi:hypothetical protein